MNRIWIGILALFAGLAMISCEKESSHLVMPQRPQVGAGPGGDPDYEYYRYSSEGKLRDSVYFYTYYFYLWQDQLPWSFPTHNYWTAEGVLNALKSYAKDPVGQPIDRYSFLDREGTINQEIQQGYTGSFGFDIRYYTEEALYIKLVDEGSPAYNAGLRRGWQLTEVNGRRDLSLSSMEQDDFEFLFRALYDAPGIQLKAKNPAGQELSFNLQKAIYNIRPILAHQIFDAGGEKVGYFAFNMFVTNALIRSQVDNIMSQFSAAGVKKLIVDLRYNGGGDVATANYITNLLAPASANNQLMNDYVINNTLWNEGWGFFIFYPEYFNKTNSLDPDRVYFLVTNGTASASELLINNLTPYMDVKLIGDGNTYGKPVGYFGWDIMGVDLYAVSFQTLNANNFGDFYNGMPVDQYARDGLNKDFGDPQEEMTAHALYHVQHGTFPAVSGAGLDMSTSARIRTRDNPDMNKRLDHRSPKAMFDFRKVKKDE